MSGARVTVLCLPCSPGNAVCSVFPKASRLLCFSFFFLALSLPFYSHFNSPSLALPLSLFLPLSLCRWSCGTNTRWPVSPHWCSLTRPRGRWCVETASWWCEMIQQVRTTCEQLYLQTFQLCSVQWSIQGPIPPLGYMFLGAWLLFCQALSISWVMQEIIRDIWFVSLLDSIFNSVQFKLALQTLHLSSVQ